MHYNALYGDVCNFCNRVIQVIKIFRRDPQNIGNVSAKSTFQQNASIKIFDLFAKKLGLI